MPKLLDAFGHGFDEIAPRLIQVVGVILILWEPFVDGFNHPPVFFGGFALVGVKTFWPGREES